MASNIHQHIQKINQRLTRYQCQKARYLYRTQQTPAQFRKARTRTLIQLGGLVEKAGLLEPLNITLGDNLQKDINHLESAAILIGAMSELRKGLSGEDAHAQKIIWRERGKKVLGL